jgi:leucyl aminopeptidase (aminopeptidase T)
MNDAVALAAKILTTNLGLKPNERILIVHDKLTEHEAVVWRDSAKVITNKVQRIEIPVMTHSGQEPPAEIVTACRDADVVILHTTYSLTHTSAGKAGRENGGRVASLPGVDLEMMMRTLSVDYQPIKDLGDRLAQQLNNGNTLHITSPTGTDLTCKIRPNGVINDGGILEPGQLGNLPAGEVFFCPIDNSTNGTWIVNGSLGSDSIIEPITISIKNGVAIEIKGDAVADRFREKLTSIGPNAFIVAEIGLGTNPQTNPLGKLIEAEKAYGTAHLALGNSIGFGGSNNVPIHIDGLTLEPTVTLDNNALIDNGIVLA